MANYIGFGGGGGGGGGGSWTTISNHPTLTNSLWFYASHDSDTVSGSTVSAEVGSNFTLSTGSTIETALVGQGALFNSSGEYSRADQSTQGTLSGCTLAFWVKPSTNNAQSCQIYDPAAAANSLFGVLSSGGTTYVVFGDSTALQYGVFTPGTTSSAFYLIALVFDGTQSTDATRVKVFVNNVQKTITFTGHPGTTLDPLMLRVDVGYWSAQNTYANGTYDEIMGWTRALTSDELTDLYNSGNGVPYN